jgi:hypothetical protein
MNTGQKLHIVSFDIPYPPDYGGVIDVFYKLKSLAEEGVKIFLHCFQYNKGQPPELENYCEKVFYYPREKGLKYFFNKLPYIVATRNSTKLLANLKSLEAPILFEGLHTCFFINHPDLHVYKKIVRMHNIEHDYYFHLARAEKNLLIRTYFSYEAKKLKRFESILKFADTVLSISPSDQQYFERIHPQAILMTAFSGFEKVSSKPGKGDYFVFHGNLNVGENKKAVDFLINEVFNDLEFSLVIAGKNPSGDLLVEAGKTKNVRVVANPSFETMQDLIENAQGCIITTFQATGLKLKLFASLYSGRFCIANSLMANNTGLEDLCIIADSAKDMKDAVMNYSIKEFTEFEIQKRRQILETEFSNKIKTKRILNLIGKK